MGGTRLKVIADATLRTGAEIDVPARIGWTLRMARLTAPIDDARLRTVGASIGTSAAKLSRLETGQLRDGSVVDGYEQALGLAQGSLRAPIDILCRTFPRACPPDANPGSTVDGVVEMSRLTDRLLASEPVDGGTWLRWARALASPGNIGLRESVALLLLRRLVDELARAVSHGYPTRYEALALIRCSAYGHLVLEVAREEAGRPHARGLADLMSAVGEAVTADAVEWCLGLLTDEREHVAMCAALAIENMAEVEGPTFWHEVARALISAFDATAAGSRQEDWVAHLMRLVPVDEWRHLGTTPCRSLPPAPGLGAPHGDDDQELWRACRRAAHEIGEAAGVGDQPMLARLMFDIAYGHWESRAVTSYMLLSGLPTLTGPAGEYVARLTEVAADPRVRERGARRLAGALHGQELSAVSRWLDSEDVELRRSALVAAGAAGRSLPSDDLAALALDEATADAALYAAGMTEHPVLDSLAADDSRPPWVRATAQWWLARGGRIED